NSRRDRSTLANHNRTEVSHTKSQPSPRMNTNFRSSSTSMSSGSSTDIGANTTRVRAVHMYVAPPADPNDRPPQDGCWLRQTRRPSLVSATSTCCAEVPGVDVASHVVSPTTILVTEGVLSRSEEHRVGKECRSRWPPAPPKKTETAARSKLNRA